MGWMGSLAESWNGFDDAPQDGERQWLAVSHGPGTRRGTISGMSRIDEGEEIILPGAQREFGGDLSC